MSSRHFEYQFDSVARKELVDSFVMKLQADALLGIIGEFGVIERSVRAFENGRRIYSDAGEFTLLNCFNSNGDRHAENHQVVENPGAIDCQSQIFRVRRPEQLPGTENKPGGIECNKNAVRFDDVPVDEFSLTVPPFEVTLNLP